MKNALALFAAVIIISLGATLAARSSRLGAAVCLAGNTGLQSAPAGEYQDVRIKKFPIAMQCWTFRKFPFFEALKKAKELGVEYVQAFPGQAIGPEDSGIRFDHNLSDDQIKMVKEMLKENGLRLAAYGVVNLGETEESMRRVFGFAQKMGIGTIVAEPRDEDFPLLEKLVKEYSIRIAIHNHPEPSKYARPQTVLDRVQGKDDRIGASADTGHWMRTGVVPVEALRLLKGRIMDVHLKDLNAFGDPKAYDVPFGQGLANIKDILAELTLQNFSGYLTVEYENEQEADNPSPSVKKGIEYIRSVTYYQDYEELLSRWDGQYNKHGWNHYGPGHFELDEKEGILKSQGGMGLFWYSVKKFKDFVLELDFKCSQNNTNSGIFLRVPSLPVSDDYIYHSFEVQIYDAGQGIHKTAAVYDAQAPSSDAAKPTAEWNHFKILFEGKHLQVELNGRLVLDWEAEPRGKVKDLAEEGYIGLQNHDSISPVYFRNIFIKELE
jgi:sugar phosphate isomerase/epimerase